MSTSTNSGQWTTFQTPACQVDFPDSAEQARMDALWDANLQGFTAQGITGNPWTATHSSAQTWYFNPTTSDTLTAQYSPITWSPVPGRIRYYFRSIGNDDLWSLADTGHDTAGNTFQKIPVNPCDPDNSSTQPYGPYGPRGWQDEYCEWAITRDTQDNIVRIDFTCENPEYYNTLWIVSPERVLQIYRATLDKPQIVLDDLCLRDSSRNIVLDPSTGRPAYDPLNKWNFGIASTGTGGGAMHLTSTPNTLQTEIGLGGGATTPRSTGNTNPGALICCAQYGQIGRNSDPHIGQSVNQVVSPPNPSVPSAQATLANPPGLYIQTPSFGRISAPGGVDPSTFWTVKRGRASLEDGQGRPLPGNFILHATFEVPAAHGFTISDLKVDNVPVKWAAQIAQTFNMQIAAMALPKSPRPQAQACVGAPGVPFAQPLQLFHAPVFNAMYATSVPNPLGFPMSLASNSTMIAPSIAAGTLDVAMTLVVAGVEPARPPSVTFGPGVHVSLVGPLQSVTYTIPGNSYPSQNYALPIVVSVDLGAAKGLRGVQVNNAGQPPAAEMPALLHIV